LKIFCSYSHKDAHLRDELVKHLETLRRQRFIEIWHDRRIVPGDKWRQEINSNLDQADVVLLLVSPDFLASKYCYEKELKTALRLAKAGRTRILPIILRPCDWRESPIGQFQALPSDGKPISSWHSRDEIWATIAAELRSLASKPSASSLRPAPRSSTSRRTGSKGSSHLLIEKNPPFSELLRTELKSRSEKFNITSDYFEETNKPFNRDSYRAGIDRFLADSKAKWLLTVYPEERRCRFQPEEERALIAELERNGKFMVCFESGLPLIGHNSDSVLVFETDQEGATEDLLLHLCDDVLPGQEKIHFVTLFGPKGHSIVDRRCHLQLEFLTRTLTRQWGSRAPDPSKKSGANLPWEDMLGFARSSKPVHVSSLPSNSWSRQKAKTSVESSWRSLDLDNDDVHTCFICVNDDVAMGVREAIEAGIGPAADLNVSFYGFDGISEMTASLADGIRGCTMCVQFGQMMQELEFIMENGFSPNRHPPFQAKRFPDY